MSSGLGGPTIGPLLQASDGNFYGATFAETPQAAGQIYRVTPDGTLESLYQFPAGEGSMGGLIEARNGLLYGTALYPSAICPDSAGEVFSISVSGQFQSLYRFTGCYPSGVPLGPSSGLLEASDGYLYGATVGYGLENDGQIFRISLDGSSLSKIASFDIANGDDPIAGGPLLTQGSDGALYGATESGGLFQAGVVYKLDLGLTPPLPSLRLYQPQSGAPGTTVRLKGDHLIGLLGVSFNGVPAQFRAVNVNYAYAVVPAGATTGPITVTTMNGSGTTSKDFVVP